MALANNYKTFGDLLTYLRGCEINMPGPSRADNKPDYSFKMRCYHCNEPGHRSFNCPRKRSTGQNVFRRANKIICRFCKISGHFEKDCRKKKRELNYSKNT